MKIDVNIMPVMVKVFGIEMGESVLIAWGALAVVLVLLVLANFYIRKRFQEKPKGLQVVLETMVGGVEKWAKGYVGESATFLAPMTMTLMFYVFAASIVELVGLPAATSDINCTFALGLCCFITFNVVGIRTRGLRGRLSGLAHPNPIVFPIRVIADCITPFSMGIRLFSNILAGSVIMELIYLAVPVVMPAALSSFFTVFEIGIQAFVFGLLSLIYTSEAVE